MEIEAKGVASRIDALVDRVDREHAVDILIRYSKRDFIPEFGLGGSCYEKNIVTIIVAPDSENFERSMENGEFGSTLAHELRHATVGYGATLGEAIVSEGLADHFATEVTGCAGPIWTEGRSLSSSVIDEAESRLKDVGYDHAEWFFGRGVQPRWAGYALGWRTVEAYLSHHPDKTAASLVGTNANAILQEGWEVTKRAIRRGNVASPA